MNGREFLAGLPTLPESTQRITFNEFKQKIGTIYWSQKRLVGSAGGNLDDSLRGFGPIACRYQIPTETGEILWSDNDTPDILAATINGEKWRRDYSVGGYAPENAIERDKSQRLDAIRARSLYMSPSGLKDGSLAPKIPTRFPGWFVQWGWVRREGVTYREGGEEHIGLYRLSPESDTVMELHSESYRQYAAPWWYKDMSIADLFEESVS